MEKLTSDAYWFNVAIDDREACITLIRTKDNAQKKFRLCGGHSRQQLVDYMNSLTDVQCNDFFPKARK